ncbi:ATP-binding protein [Salidesulfovibrio brasiliensis]|uniref:ATP-binding protein n=1 Tax=Salidesulfovibrio brasiliensis TaxID=221711 RepID=UPI0006D1864A|nr:transporter substrate-binding domain-containing protein [Salidesulfovibrio brasiliensis]
MVLSIRFVAIIFLLISAVLPVRADGLELTQTEREWIASSDSIRVFIGNWPPFQIMEPAPHGICRDYLELVEQKTGLDFEYVKAPATWGQTLESMRGDDPLVDVLPTIRRTKAREQYLLMTDPYLALPWVIVTRKDYPRVSSLADLPGAAVAVPKDFVIHEMMERDYPDMRYLLTDNPEQALMAVSTGAVDAFVGNIAGAAWLIDKNGLSNLKIASSTEYGRHEQSMGVRRDMPELASVLNKALASITPEERAQILNHWGMLRVEQTVAFGDILHWALMILLPGAGIVLVLCYSNRKLRREVAERKEAERRARESQEVLQHVFDGLHAAVVTVEPKDQVVIDANEQAEVLTGYSREELIGRTCHFLCGRMSAKGQFAGCPLLNKNIHLGEFVATRADGRKVPIMKTVVASRREGRVVFLEVIFDISEKKEMERNHLQAQKLESIGRLAAGVAHEINTPSQFVGDNLRFLKEELEPFISMVDEARKELCPTLENMPKQGAVERFCDESHTGYLLEEMPQALDETLDGVKRITQIVRSMKSFAHPDEIRPIEIDVAEAVQNTVMVARNEWKQVADVQVDVPEKLPRIRVIPGQFNQVVLNLLINAVDAIREKVEGSGDIGRVRITGRLHGDMVELTVNDNANGIPESARDNVFDPFFTTKPVGRGTGQGLSIAYAVIVEKYGGELFFDSTVGKGTTFTVRLPAAD